MNEYVRPPIDAQAFLDADGHAIDYGDRWKGSPPVDTYSVDTHPERFEPIHTVADALIDYLVSAYDVEVYEGVETAADLLHPSYHEVLRAVRLRPASPACAPLTFVFTSYPGILIHAGLLNDFHYPVCGCDACDSNWPAEADELEQQVLAMVSGRYRETIERREQDPWVGYAFTYADGGSSGGGSRESRISLERYEHAQSILRNLAGAWAEWPRIEVDS